MAESKRYSSHQENRNTQKDENQGYIDFSENRQNLGSLRGLGEREIQDFENDTTDYAAFDRAADQSGNQANEQGAKKDKMIQVNGFMQVLEMLKVADPEFRDSLLRRIGQKNQLLAANLKRELGK